MRNTQSFRAVFTCERASERSWNEGTKAAPSLLPPPTESDTFIQLLSFRFSPLGMGSAAAALEAKRRLFLRSHDQPSFQSDISAKTAVSR